jgi:hypothetical protein
LALAISSLVTTSCFWKKVAASFGDMSLPP